MNSLLTLSAAVLLASAASSPLALAATSPTSSGPATGVTQPAAVETAQRQVPMPYGDPSNLPPAFVNGSYRPGYGLYSLRAH